MIPQDSPATLRGRPSVRARAIRAIALGATLGVASSAGLLVERAAHAEPIVTKWYPFELRDGHLHVPVKVAGIETTAVLDTGSPGQLLDRAFAVHNGIAISTSEGSAVLRRHSRQHVPVARDVPIELFGASTQLQVVPVAENLFAPLVLGFGILQSWVVQIDYVNERIRFASFDAVDQKAKGNVELRRAGANGPPALRATIDGEDTWLLLDTGFTGPLILTPEFVNPRGWPEAPGKVSSDGFGRVAFMNSHRVPLLQIGPFDLRGVVSATPADGRLPPVLTAGGRGNVHLSGVLGAAVLKHFMITLDLEHLRADLQQAEQVPESRESSQSKRAPAAKKKARTGAAETAPTPKAKDGSAP